MDEVIRLVEKTVSERKREQSIQIVYRELLLPEVVLGFKAYV